jgi:hypothetical protein
MKLRLSILLLALAALPLNSAHAACALSNAQLFQNWDLNHDGFLDEGEYVRGETDRLNRLNQTVPNNSLIERFQSFGQDAIDDDRITVDEFAPLNLPDC